MKLISKKKVGSTLSDQFVRSTYTKMSIKEFFSQIVVGEISLSSIAKSKK